MSCPSCQIITCENESDVSTYSLQSGIIFTNGTLSFVPVCPTGYDCYNLPIIVIVPPGTFEIVFPPSNPSTMRIDCCQSSVVRTVPGGASAAAIAAIAAEMLRECARQSVECGLINGEPPGVVVTPVDPPIPPPVVHVKINVCNEEQVATAMCGDGGFGVITRTVAACIYGEVLWDPTPAFIATRQAYWNSVALAQANALIAAVTPPSISNGSSLADGTVDEPYSVQLNGVGASPFTFVITDGTLPPGLSMSSSGLISGTPTEEDGEGDFFNVQITDVNGDSCSKTFGIVVLPPGECEVTSQGGFCLERDKPYSNQYAAAGGTGPYVFTISAGSIPTGLTMSAAGLLSGTPTVNATYNFTVKATDSLMMECTVDQTIQVTALCGLVNATNPDELVWTDTLPAYGGFSIVFSDGANATFSGPAIVNCTCPTSGQEIIAGLCNPCAGYDIEIRFDFAGSTSAPFSCFPAADATGRFAFSVYRNGVEFLAKYYSTALPATDIISGAFSGFAMATIPIAATAGTNLEIFMSLCQGTSVSGTITITPARHP